MSTKEQIEKVQGVNPLEYMAGRIRERGLADFVYLEMISLGGRGLVYGLNPEYPKEYVLKPIFDFGEGFFVPARFKSIEAGVAPTRIIGIEGILEKYYFAGLKKNYYRDMIYLEFESKGEITFVHTPLDRHLKNTPWYAKTKEEKINEYVLGDLGAGGKFTFEQPIERMLDVCIAVKEGTLGQILANSG